MKLVGFLMKLAVRTACGCEECVKVRMQVAMDRVSHSYTCHERYVSKPSLHRTMCGGCYLHESYGSWGVCYVCAMYMEDMLHVVCESYVWRMLRESYVRATVCNSMRELLR